MVDDAYIAVRYAQNLLAGDGLVYNHGQHVLGVTGPLYTIWMAALLLVSPADDPGYAIGVANILFFAFTALAMLKLAPEVGAKTIALVVLMFSAHLRFVDNTLVGMETPLFLLGVVLSVLLLREARLTWLFLLLGLLMLVRPEGTLWALSVVVALAARRQTPRLRQLLPGAAVILVWVVFSGLYYGSPIPHSVLAKSGWFIGEGKREFWPRIASTFQSLALLDLPERFRHAAFARAVLGVATAVSLALFFLGGRALWRLRSRLVAFPVFFLACVCFYIVGRGRVDFSWYGIPTGFAYGVTAIVGGAAVARRLPGWGARARLFAIAVFGAALLLIGSGVWIWQATRLPYYRVMRASYEPAGEFVNAHARADACVVVDELGMIGYRARRTTYDLGGIVSPEILRHYAKGNRKYTWSDYLQELRPDYIICSPRNLGQMLTEEGAPWVEANYETVAEFPAHGVLGKRTATAPGSGGRTAPGAE